MSGNFSRARKRHHVRRVARRISLPSAYTIQTAVQYAFNGAKDAAQLRERWIALGKADRFWEMLQGIAENQVHADGLVKNIEQLCKKIGKSK
jgi:hypothetical protein